MLAGKEQAEKARVAYHEAGHAVVAAHYSTLFTYSMVGGTISIEPEEISAGRVHSRWRNRDAEQQVQISLAGVLAERLKYGRWPPQAFIRAIEDLKTALDLTRASQTPDLGGSLDWSISQASSILVTRCAALDEVAALLLSKTRLTQDEVQQVVTSHGSDEMADRRMRRQYPSLRAFLMKDCDRWWEIMAGS